MHFNGAAERSTLGGAATKNHTSTKPEHALSPGGVASTWPPGPRAPGGPCPPRTRRVCPQKEQAHRGGFRGAAPVEVDGSPLVTGREAPGLFPSGGRPPAGSTYIPFPLGSCLSGALPAGGAEPRPTEQRHCGHRKREESRRRLDRFYSARPEGRGGARPPPPASSSSSLSLIALPPQGWQSCFCGSWAFCGGAASALPSTLQGLSPHRLP